MCGSRKYPYKTLWFAPPPPPTPQDFLFQGVFDDPFPPGISRIFKRGLSNPLGKYLYLRHGWWMEIPRGGGRGQISGMTKNKYLGYASVNSTCNQLPPRLTPRHWHVFLPWMANSRGWGRKKTANAASSVNTAGRRWNWLMHYKEQNMQIFILRPTFASIHVQKWTWSISLPSTWSKASSTKNMWLCIPQFREVSKFLHCESSRLFLHGC